MALKLSVVFFLVFITLFWQTNFVKAHPNPTIASPSAWPQFDQGKIDEAINHLSPVNKLPGNSLYFLIILKENAERFFKPTPVERAIFDIKLSGKRLKESYLLEKEEDNYSLAQDNLKKYDLKITDIFDQLQKIEKQNLANFSVLEDLANNLIYQRTMFAVMVQSQKYEVTGKDANINHSAGEFERLVEYAIEALPNREHELRLLLPTIIP